MSENEKKNRLRLFRSSAKVAGKVADKVVEVSSNNIGAVKDGIGAGRQVLQLSSASTAESLSSGLYVVAVGVTGYNIVALPLYIAIHYMRGEKIILELPLFLRWLYSVAAFSLIIAGIIFPPFALVFGIATATLSLGLALTQIVHFIYHRVRIELALRGVAREIKNTSEADVLMDLNQKELDLLKEKSRFGNMVALDRSVAIAIAAMFVVGGISSLFLPGLGFGILLTTGVISVSYALGRLLLPTVFHVMPNPVAVVKASVASRKTTETSESSDLPYTSLHAPAPEEEEKLRPSNSDDAANSP